jgi:hypothetical protein
MISVYHSIAFLLFRSASLTLYQTFFRSVLAPLYQTFFQGGSGLDYLTETRLGKCFRNVIFAYSNRKLIVKVSSFILLDSF